MNSVLNPEAPEFHPHLNVIQDGYISVNKTIKISNSFPVGASYDLFKTFTDFNIVTCKLSENVEFKANQIVVAELPAVKLKCNDNENNTEKIIDVNDSILDRININIDTVSGDYKPNESFVKGMQASWNNSPVITKIKMGSATLIGAKNIPRPQLNFKDHIDNSANLWVPKISDKPNNIKPLALNILYNEDGEVVGYEHPYKIELDLYQPPERFLAAGPAPFPPPLADTPLTYVDTAEKLDQLVRHLTDVTEIAVDLEHHSYRTYQGITCLIQITTDEGGDFIIDTLAIREHIHKLNVSFTDPKKVKVLHGAERDVVWLQRDFGVYIVGLFDTHQAAKVLNLNGLSLKYLLMNYCQVEADKKYQLADWRMRPLPEELIEYARSDTHYLLYIWRQMKKELLESNGGKLHQLLNVFDMSRLICGMTYNKEVLHDGSHLPLYTKSRKSFNSQQMSALKLLYKWRDEQARELDESTTYLLPNHMLLTLAEALPREIQGVNACCSPMPPFVKQNLITIHRMILSCRELPQEPQLFQIPTSVRTMLNDHPNLVSYNVHDMSPYSELSTDPINLEFTYPFLTDPKKFQPDIEPFSSKYSLIKDHTYEVISDLNADAQLFIPPYDRYRKYRTLAQTVEIREFREKEAKITAISKGNELIKTEVIIKLQEAQAAIEKASGGKLTAKELPPTEDTKRDDVIVDYPDEIKFNDYKKACQRKRKIIEKAEQKEELNKETSENKKKDNQKTSNKASSSKAFSYKNINYNKFYSDIKRTKATKAAKEG